jgi:NADH-quinone oxidoreductase subunit J
VLFLFVIMLVSIEKAQREEQFNHQWHIAILATVVLAVLFVYVYYRGYAIFPNRELLMPETMNTQQVGLILYAHYMLPFEVASVLLLVAIIGAVVMAKKRI